MIASGQLVKDIKKEYIKEKKENFISGNDASLKKTFIPVSDDVVPAPEYFSHTRKKIYLNQDAMVPVQSKPKINDQKEGPTKQEIVTKKLEDLADKSSDVLMRVSTVFPFTFFVNDIIVDPYKVNVVFREFFYSEHIHSIMVKDILDVVVETSLFFATVKIVDQGYTENSVNITYLKKEDALKLRKIIQGLVIAHRQAVDLSAIDPSQIKDKAEELGKVEGIDDTQKKIEQL